MCQIRTLATELHPQPPACLLQSLVSAAFSTKNPWKHPHTLLSAPHIPRPHFSSRWPCHSLWPSSKLQFLQKPFLNALLSPLDFSQHPPSWNSRNHTISYHLCVLRSHNYPTEGMRTCSRFRFNCQSFPPVNALHKTCTQ